MAKTFDASDPRPKLHAGDVPALDTDSIDTSATKAVLAELSKKGSREARLQAAADLVDAEVKNEVKFRAKRDLHAVALDHFYNAWRGAALHAAVGVNRSRWLAMRAEADAYPGCTADKDGTHLPSCNKRTASIPMLVKFAAATYEARKRAEVARRVRDDLVREFVGEGWTNVQIANLIGRHPTQIAHIKAPEQRKTPNRPDQRSSAA